METELLEVVVVTRTELESVEELAAIELEDEELAGFEVVELAPDELAHTSCVEPISHAVPVAKPLNRKALIAFKFAPEKELSGTVMVWVAPVSPLTWKYVLLYAVFEQAVLV